jgi:hypothetical protein
MSRSFQLPAVKFLAGILLEKDPFSVLGPDDQF